MTSDQTTLTTKEMSVLRRLSERTGYVARRELKASFEFMQDLYFRGLVDGAGSRDHRGTGNTPDSSWWRITENGRDHVQS